MKKPVYFIVLILIVTFSVTQVCFGEQQAVSSEKDISAATEADSYRIGSGDILEIITWKEPDFSREVRVRIDGKFAFPLIGEIEAAAHTPLAIRKNIETKIAEYIEGAIVTVIVKEPASQKFYILGEVVRTGEYQLVKDLTVLQAFALAGGFTEWASKNEIILLRRVGGETKMISVKYKDVVKGKDLSQDISIKANDTIIVP